MVTTKNKNFTPIMVIIGVIGALISASLVLAGGRFGIFGLTMLSGLFQGMLLFLVASGLSIIFGLMDVLTLAQGAYFMIGAYVAHDIQHPGGLVDLTLCGQTTAFTLLGLDISFPTICIADPNIRFPVALIGAVTVGAILGAILERGLLRPLYSRPIFQLVLTFGVSLVLIEVIKFFWSTTPYAWTQNFVLSNETQSSFMLFGQRFGMYRLFVIAMGAVLIVAIAFLLRRTRMGIIIRAGVEDREMVEALGINVRMVFTLVFTLGCAVAAFGGAVAAPFLGASTSAIAVVVLGGMGSYEGTAAGSVMVGLAVAVAQQATIGTSLNVLPSITPMLLLILVLLLRPSGLFGSKH
jgi:branched-chain amino acid transport system permease protein